MKEPVAANQPTSAQSPGSSPAGSDRTRSWLRRLGAALLVLWVLWRVATWPNEIALAGPTGQLQPCGVRPNCVTTETDFARHAMPPVPFGDAPGAAQARARAALLVEPRTRIVSERPGYLHAQSMTRVFGFVDDVEIVVDANAGVFRFRSASRQGNTDGGVNRKRMQRVSERLQGSGARLRMPGAPR